MQKNHFLFVIAFTILLMNSCMLSDLNGQLTVIDQVEKSFDNVASLIVKGSFCYVDIDSGTSSSVNFKGEIKSQKERDDIKIEYKQNGSALEVWIERPNSIKGSVSGSLVFKVPANTNINVKNSSGSVSVNNIGQSVVDLTTSSGSIKADNIDSNLSAQASSGSIKVSNISGNLDSKNSSGSQSIYMIKGEVTSFLSSGRIEIKDVNGSVKSTSSSGSQSISKVSGDVNSTASSGSIKFEEINGNIKARASSGSINLSHIKGALNISTSSGGQHGTEVTLSGNSTFNSSSGSIKMELINSTDELSFNLTASSGGLKAKQKSGHKKLIIEKGSIMIKGTSSSGSQNYY